MKAAMMVEDRDIGYLFLDPSKAPPAAMPYEFTVEPGVAFSDIESDDKVLWFETSEPPMIRVVPAGTAPREGEMHIPSCLVFTDADGYEAFMAQ